MNNETGEPPGTDLELEKQYPRWWIWQSDTGMWWASVRENLTPSQLRAGCRPHLDADGAEELAVLLTEQDRRAKDAS